LRAKQFWPIQGSYAIGVKCCRREMLDQYQSQLHWMDTGSMTLSYRLSS